MHENTIKKKLYVEIYFPIHNVLYNCERITAIYFNELCSKFEVNI